MNYFKTSYPTLQRIAKAGKFEDVAGFLVLARHATGLAVAGFEPYKLSGAGINSIHEKAGLSEESARGVIERLQAGGFIRPVTPETRKAFSHARWEIVQGALDLDLPHVFVDVPKLENVTSIMRRIKDVKTTYEDVRKQVSDTEIRLDALMMMLAFYKHTNMLEFGGLNPNHGIYRAWKTESQTPKKGMVRWGAEPVSLYSRVSFQAECMAHVKAGPKSELTDLQKSRFWNAWHGVENVGLVYEAVALFDTDPNNNISARLMLSIRVNDFHAGAASKTGDPSLLRELEASSGALLGYYTPPVNERDEPEAMWVMLPDKRGALVGVYRPRFRPSTTSVGAWIDKENDNIAATMQRLQPALQ